MSGSARKVATLQDFDISPNTGFLPEQEPLHRLPDYFNSWEDVCERIPELWKSRMTRSVIEKIPLLSCDKLSCHREWVRADVVLTFLSHSYVMCVGEKGVAKVLPKCLSIPWSAVAKHLGLPPVIVHYCFTVNNWKIVDPNRPLHMDNIKTITSFTGSKSEEGFNIVAVQIELEFGKSVQSIIEAQQAVQDENVENLKQALQDVCKMITRITMALLKMHDVCDPHDFYTIIRHFLSGWQKGSALSDGLVYEGVSPYPQRYRGGSGAQCAVFPVLDAFLGVQHQSTPSKNSLLEETRYYIPPKHRQFIKAVEEGPSIREFVRESHDNSLVKSYNACVDALVGHRNTHIQVTTKYVVIQANMDPDNSDSVLAKRGTGGSDLIKFLQRIRNETQDAKLPCDDETPEVAR